MNPEVSINALSKLGQWLDPRQNDHESLFYKAKQENGWFTIENCQQAFSAWAKSLQADKLLQWLSAYTLPTASSKNIGLVLAGNIPLVGLHDVLSVLVVGHKAQLKASSSDSVLLKAVLDQLIVIEPSFQKRVIWAHKLEGFDAVIATGSSNTSRYFDYYFGKYPHIIRKNRTSVALLTGDESREELTALGKDIFQYFGLGCRNVSKLFVPNNYDFQAFFESIEVYATTAQHHKYHNNYDYNRALLLMNQNQHLDNGFLLVEEQQALHSPLSILYFERYSFLSEAEEKINSLDGQLQCKVGQSPGCIPFGKSQEPELWDYADQVDTLAFLLRL